MKIREIERLRGLAIFIVLNGHVTMGLRPIASEYFFLARVGVDLFFVISGFVIGRSLLELLPRFSAESHFLERLRASRSALRSFYTRRFFRIVPMALLWVGIALLLSYSFNDHQKFDSPESMYHQILNLLTLRLNYWDQGTLGIYWSLVVEEHFYLFVPFILILFANDRARLFFILTSIVIVAFVIRPYLPPIYGTSNPEVQAHLVTHRKVDALFAGLALAVLQRNRNYYLLKDVAPILFLPIAAFSAVGLWTAPMVLPPEWMTTHSMVFVWFFSAILVWAASHDRGLVFEIPLLKTFLEYLGSRSYGIYLVHGFAFQVIREGLARWDSLIPQAILHLLSTKLGFWTMIAFFVLIPVEICYRYFEQPLIRYGRHLSDRIRPRVPLTSPIPGRA